MGRNRKIASLIMLSFVISMPLLATAQNKSIIIGEGVRGAMYIPACCCV